MGEAHTRVEGAGPAGEVGKLSPFGGCLLLTGTSKKIKQFMGSV